MDMTNLRRTFLRRLSAVAAVPAAVLGFGTARVQAAAGQSGGSPRKQPLRSSRLAPPIGPFSQGIRSGDTVYVAGLTGIDVKTGKIVPGGIVAETRQALENIKAVLAEAGGKLDDAVSAVVHMTDLGEFQQMNQVYAEYFSTAPPGRTTVQVAAIPAGARVEITVVAVVAPGTESSR
jgi:2-iminobutanoate/2-iminopropanoate deaminase